MCLSWITLYPDWYSSERSLIAQHYPSFRADEVALRRGELRLYGELVVRPSGGSHRHAVQLAYPDCTPYEHPVVTPLKRLPGWTDQGGIASTPEPDFYDHRHQMPGGNLCLFQRETRGVPGGDVMDARHILRRAEQWFIGHHTGRWPTDTAQSELESHFRISTDVLVPSSFYREDLDGYGRLFLAPNLLRFYADPHSASCPLVLTALTEESSGIVKSMNAREELSRVYPWIENSAWDATGLAASRNPGADENKRLEYGYWWSLSREPRPFRDGTGLLRELEAVALDGDAWAMVSALMKGDISVSDKHFLGLRYPSREGGYEWLILLMPRERDKAPAGAAIIKSEAQKREAFEKSPVFAVRSNKLEPNMLRLRNSGVVDGSVVDKTVALIGLGALGSEIAELLAKAGVGRFRLCDLDRLTTGNVARHAGGINDYGMPKTSVVKKRLLNINPYLVFQSDDIINGSAVASLDCLSAFMEQADVIVCTTADENVESAVNQIAVLLRKPVIYGRSMRGASFGRVFLVRPGTDACKSCLADYLALGRKGTDTPSDWIDVPESDASVLLHECGRPVIASSALDLSFIASLTGRVALSFLEGKLSAENHWVWSQQSAMDIDPRLDSPMSTFVGCLPPRSSCSTCQEPDVVGLVLSEDALATIVSETESSTDRETGGILIGFVDDQDRAVAVRATGPGPNAVRTPTLFRRDVEYAQCELDRAATDLGANGKYIGEWHSHLVQFPQPSPVDIDSLSGISRASNYLTRCPVMAICGLNVAQAKIAGIGSWVFPVGERVYEVSHTELPAGEAMSLPLKSAG